MIIRWIVLSTALFVTDVISTPIFAVLIALTICRGIINLFHGEEEKFKESEAEKFVQAIDAAVNKRELN